MSLKKMEGGFVDNYTLHMEGTYLVISYRGKEWIRLNIKHCDTMNDDLEVYLGQVKGAQKMIEIDDAGTKAPISVDEVLAFAQAYQGLQRKYTGRFAKYVPNGTTASAKKNWTALERATGLAKTNNLSPLEFLSLLMKHYTRRAGSDGSQMSFPFPNQISGDWAQQVIIEEIGRSNPTKVDPAVRASRLAATNRYLKLDVDQAYLEARARCKNNTHTRFDIEYMKARTTQVFGEPKDWIAKFENQLNERERDGDGSDEK